MALLKGASSNISLLLLASIIEDPSPFYLFGFSYVGTFSFYIAGHVFDYMIEEVMSWESWVECVSQMLWYNF